MPRAAPTGRGVGASRSFDPSLMERGGGPPPRSRSGDLHNMTSTSRGRAPPQSRGIGRGRSMSPSRVQQQGGGGGSEHRGRAPPDRRGVTPSRSFDPSLMGAGGGNRGRPSPKGRGLAPTRSFDVGAKRPTASSRQRSMSPSRRMPPSRSRSMSPSRMAAAMSQQGGGGPSRGRSQSPSRGGKGGRFSRSFRKLRGGGGSSTPAYNNPNRRGAALRKFGKMGQSMRRIAPKEQCGLKKICCYVTPILIMLASAGGLITATGNAGKVAGKVIPEGLQDTLADFIPKFDNSKLNDPFAAGTDIPIWPTEGAGLKVKIENACDDAWDTEFTLAVSDWDFGNPDALDLSESGKVARDSVCTELKEGVIKVCNADFGETPWRGLNQLTTGEGGWVTASLAQMNDYYLKNEEDAARRYTMCHELGHAFGLPHTDEEFGNEDLGNCLDYTDNFEFNMSPDASNYASLIEYYGPIGLSGGAGTLDGARRNRNLRGRDEESPTIKKMPDHIRSKMQVAVEEMKAQVIHPERHSRIAAVGWKLLHHTSRGEEHELDLGEGYKVRIHMLMAHPAL